MDKKTQKQFEKYKLELPKYKKAVLKYKKLFLADDNDKGSKEQVRLSNMLKTIKLLEDQLTLNTPPSPNIQDLLTVTVDYSWMDKIDKWLNKNSLNLTINKLSYIVKKLRKEVEGLDGLSDKILIYHVRTWAKKNHIQLSQDDLPLPGSVGEAMSDFLDQFKNLGKFDWKFSGGSLKLDLIGTTAALGYKGKNDEISLTVSKDDVKAKLTSSDKDTTATIEGKVDYEGQGGLDVSVKEKNTSVTVGVDVKNPKEDKDGKQEEDKGKEVTASLTVKLEDIIKFNSTSASVNISLSGNNKSWSFGLEISTSGGKQAHLSRKASEKIKKVITTASDSLRAIYGILDTESFSDLKAIKDKIKPYWDNVDKAISLLSKDIKTPVAKNEVYISFGVVGGKETPTAVTAGLTFTF